jgi:hypothetical protein
MTAYIVVWNGINQDILTDIISAGLKSKGLVGSFAVTTVKQKDGVGLDE